MRGSAVHTPASEGRGGDSVGVAPISVEIRNSHRCQRTRALVFAMGPNVVILVAPILSQTDPSPHS